MFDTVFPYWSEYTAGFENRPDQMGRLGMLEDPSLADRGRAFLLRQAQGVGVRAQTPADTKSAAYTAGEVLDDLAEKSAQGILPDKGADWIKELLGG